MGRVLVCVYSTQLQHTVTIQLSQESTDSPDELLQYIQPSHTCSVVQRGAAVVSASIGVCSGLKEYPDTVQVTVNHSYVEGRLAFDINQVHLSSLGDQIRHAGGVSGCGCDAQRSAGQTPATPHRLLIDAPAINRGMSACCLYTVKDAYRLKVKVYWTCKQNFTELIFVQGYK